MSNGTSTRLVQPFLLLGVDQENFELPGVNFNDTSIHNVLNGTISDESCTIDPCQNGGTCNVTWNDYVCTCTFGFKGKNCDELEYCARHECPRGSTCRNLLDGYECLTNITMNGSNTSLNYRANIQQPPQFLNQVSITFRSQVGGTLIYVEHDLSSIMIGVTGDGVVVQQTSNSHVVTTVLESSLVLDGQWHTLNISLDEQFSIVAIVDNITLAILQEPNNVILDLREMVLRG